MSDFHPAIDAGVRAYVEKARREAGRLAGIVDLSPTQRRLRAEVLARLTAEKHPDWLSCYTTYIVLPGRELPVRVYASRGEQRDPQPAILYLHGGSWIAGSPETHDFITASLAANTGAVLLSVHYRRAPENPFPAPTEDAYAALCWVAQEAESLGIDPTRIAIAGDSAGANLAAACALMARNRGGPAIVHQTLLYPTLDNDLETESYHAGTDPILSRTAMKEALEAFLPAGTSLTDGYALPMRAASLAGLPPACLSISALDPLRDDGVRYASRLEAAGVPTVLRIGPGLIHGYVRMRRLSAVAEAEFQAVCSEIRTALNLPEGRRW